MTAYPPTLVDASIGRRIAAYLLDFVIAFIVITVAGFIAAIGFVLLVGDVPEVLLEALDSRGAGIVLFGVYQIGFWCTLGRTPGKMAAGIRVVPRTDPQQDKLDLGTAFVRYIAYTLCSLTFGIGFLFDWSNKLPGTRTVRRQTVPLSPPPAPTGPRDGGRSEDVRLNSAYGINSQPSQGIEASATPPVVVGPQPSPRQRQLSPSPPPVALPPSGRMVYGEAGWPYPILPGKEVARDRALRAQLMTDLEEFRLREYDSDFVEDEAWTEFLRDHPVFARFVRFYRDHYETHIPGGSAWTYDRRAIEHYLFYERV